MSRLAFFYAIIFSISFVTRGIVDHMYEWIHEYMNWATYMYNSPNPPQFYIFSPNMLLFGVNRFFDFS